MPLRTKPKPADTRYDPLQGGRRVCKVITATSHSNVHDAPDWATGHAENGHSIVTATRHSIRVPCIYIRQDPASPKKRSQTADASESTSPSGSDHRERRRRPARSRGRGREPIVVHPPKGGQKTKKDKRTKKTLADELNAALAADDGDETRSGDEPVISPRLGMFRHMQRQKEAEELEGKGSKTKPKPARTAKAVKQAWPRRMLTRVAPRVPRARMPRVRLPQVNIHWVSGPAAVSWPRPPAIWGGLGTGAKAYIWPLVAQWHASATPHVRQLLRFIREMLLHFLLWAVLYWLVSVCWTMLK